MPPYLPCLAMERQNTPPLIIARPPQRSKNMPSPVSELIELLSLERLEDNLFRGQSRDIGTKYVFGGQVLGQALSAAQATLDNLDDARAAHSLHAYFLKAGDIEHPIVYQVDRTRDGGSFSVRRVTAIQHGQPIFFLAASFQKHEDGGEHQLSMPEVPKPEDIEPTPALPPEVFAKLPSKVQRWLSRMGPFEFRHVYPRDDLNPPKRPPFQQVWFKLGERVGDAPELHRALLAYASDFHLLGTATFPHGISYYQPNVQMASLDHALWFHRPFRADEWLLYSIDSPSAQGGRGLARGLIYDRSGKLVASTAQEGLIRVVADAQAAAHVPAKA
jgi:acyl-CoA thioesterase II